MAGNVAPSTGIEVRRLTVDDVPNLERFVAAARARGDIAPSSDSEGIYFLRYAAIDPDHVAIAVVGETLVGVISPEFKALVVEPGRRRKGIGRLLVAEGLAIERERDRPDVLIGRALDDSGGRAFLLATGFAYHSTLWDMALPEDRHVEGPLWPAGVQVRSLDRSRDMDVFVELFNAAFADHVTPLQLDPAQAELLDDPEIEDADMLLVETREGPPVAVGFCATVPRRPGGIVAPVADIWTIGVQPGWQGRGLGRQLLRWGVERLRGIGARQVTLSVNGRNERALGLYEQEGFVRERTRERWARPVAGEDTPGSVIPPPGAR